MSSVCFLHPMIEFVWHPELPRKEALAKIVDLSDGCQTVKAGFLFFFLRLQYNRHNCVHLISALPGHWTATRCLPVCYYLCCWCIDPSLTTSISDCSCGLPRCLFISEPFWFLFLFCSASFGVFVSLCRRWADIILWKGNDPTVLRLCMCAAHCNGPAFYCLPHTNPTTEGMRWHLQGAVCELQPHMKEWPLKMIKEITILGCTTLLSCLARCSSLCPSVHARRLARTYAYRHSYLNSH